MNGRFASCEPHDNQEECEARGAQFLEDIQTSLLHVWTVPAYTNPLGVFAHANPALPCADGSYVTTHECQVRWRSVLAGQDHRREVERSFQPGYNVRHGRA